MSLAMKAAKHGYVGDPGLFGFLGKAIGAVSNVLPGPLGMVGKAVSNVMAPQKPSVNVAQQIKPGVMITSGSIPTGVPSLPGVGQFPPLKPDSIKTTGSGLVTPYGGVGTVSQTQYFSPNGSACAVKGTHVNKQGYFLRNGQYVAPGSKCVKNRRRNPLNPRALSRAMSRLESAKRASKALQRITIKDSKGCGCR